MMLKLGVISKMALMLKLSQYLGSEPTTCANAIKQLTTVTPKRRFHHVRRRNGNMESRSSARHNRNQNVRRSRKVGRKTSKHETGYHRRSLAQTTMFRFLFIFGARLRSPEFDNQAVELFRQCAALNRMIGLGKPDSYKLEE